LRRPTQIHPAISKMVLRQGTEIRLNRPFTQFFSQLSSAARACIFC
jgi:hypothetical protein